MKVTKALFNRIRDVIPIEHLIIRRLVNKCDIYKLLDVLESQLPNSIKRDYVNSIDMNQDTLDKIWEKYQGDMWVSSDVYDFGNNTIKDI